MISNGARKEEIMACVRDFSATLLKIADAIEAEHVNEYTEIDWLPLHHELSRTMGSTLEYFTRILLTNHRSR